LITRYDESAAVQKGRTLTLARKATAQRSRRSKAVTIEKTPGSFLPGVFLGELSDDQDQKLR